jgi:hypothetical protein
MVRGPATAAEVAAALDAVRDVCARLEPVAVPMHQVVDVFDGLVALERSAGGAVLRMAARYEEAGAWKRNGVKSAEDDIARKTGTPTGRARRKLRTSKRLKDQSRTDEAVRRGRVSPDQADEISDGAAASPQDEEELLDAAAKDPLQVLRQKAAAARAKADRDREERRRRLHRQRGVRRWNDAHGMANLLVRLPDDVMAEVDAALKPRIDRAFADARNEGRMEPVEAYTADVVRDLLLGSGADASGSGRRSQAVRPEKKVIALIDAAALNRGSVENGETCEMDPHPRHPGRVPVLALLALPRHQDPPRPAPRRPTQRSVARRPQDRETMAPTTRHRTTRAAQRAAEEGASDTGPVQAVHARRLRRTLPETNKDRTPSGSVLGDASRHQTAEWVGFEPTEGEPSLP